VVDGIGNPFDGGTHTALTGWETTDITYLTLNMRLLSIKYTMPSATTNIMNMVMTYDFTLGTSSSPTNTAVAIGTDDGQTTETYGLPPATGTGLTLSYAVSQADTTYLYVFLRPHSDTTAWAGSATLTELVITGIGANPFAL